MTYRIVSIHSMDPRGTKVGGIETHVRQLLRHYPEDLPLLMIGVDDTGMLELGKVHRIEVNGRAVDFVPVVHVPPQDQIGAAKAISGSLTFKFVKALTMNLLRLRKILNGAKASAEVERVEFAPLARALGCRLVVIFHNEGDPKTDKMDSMLKRYWWIQDIAETIAFRLADRIFCVTAKLRDRVGEKHPRQLKKTDVLTVSVDTHLFYPTPFDVSDGVLRVIYAGRMDEFKDPPTMFKVCKALHDALGGKFEFHYCGAEDPHRYAEFAPIEAFTIRHGGLLSSGVAAVMRKVHIGMLVSHYEGMPCFLLETLASGRPFGGLRLPQFMQVVEEGVSGRMTDRAETDAETVARVTQTILGLWDEIRTGKIDPAAVHTRISAFSVERQLARLFDVHRALSTPRTGETQAQLAATPNP